MFWVGSLQAQFIDDFTDNDFTSNPVWTGDISNFKISTSSAIPSDMRPGLQSENIIADTSYLVSDNIMTLTDSMEWIFWSKLSFNPSANNFARVYLVADQQNLEGSLNGYYVALCHDGVDRVHLVRQDGATHTPIITGVIANMNKTTNEIRVKVKRDNSGSWTLYTDTLGENNFVEEGSATDIIYTNSSYFGIVCQYTVSNAGKFYFDDFYAGAIQVDTIAPVISSIEAINSINIDVFFDEFIDQSTAENTANYIIDSGIGSPSITELDPLDFRLVHLTLSTPISDGVLYNLQVSNVEDASGNVMLSDTVPFAYYVPHAFDVVINEIMADPSPPVLLPEYEYIELYNTTALPINLENYTLRIGTTDKSIANVVINANDYLILCDDGAETELSLYADVYSFSSFAITNGGVDISLISPAGAVLSFVNFTDAWYQDNFKDEGGWSLEQIDPLNPCVGKNNWKASTNSKGGTPGAINSVNAVNEDLLAPELLRASLLNDSTLRVWFSEPMDSSTVLNPFFYSFNNSLSILGQPFGYAPEYASVQINLNQAVSSGIIYTLSINDTMTDCVGNMMEINSSVRFAIADSIEEGDFVINEILSNPVEGVTDFIEIINRSNKILDTRFLTIATLDDSLMLDQQNYITPNGFLLFPGEYLAITEDRDALLSYYYSENPNNVFEVEDLPAYNNDEGIVVLAMAAGNIIDEVEYNVEMHDPLLNSTDGVSFERINFMRPSNDESNWHSAASTVGFATPAYLNSQYSDAESVSEITLSPEVFSPDNDGYNDVLNIAYSFDRPGLICKMQVFDDKGRFVKILADNELLGTEGVITWNGTTEDNNKASIGMYIILTEVYSSDGYSKKYKSVTVLGGNL